MKKRIIYLASVIAFVALIIGCTKLENTPSFPKSTATFTATTATTTVALTVADSAKSAVAFTWTDPKFPVGLAKTKFTIMVDSLGNGFVSFASKSFTGGLEGALLGKEINKMALQFGGVIGQPISLELKVVASLANNGESKESAIYHVTVTPYDDLAVYATTKLVVCTLDNSSQTGDTLYWTKAFSGYNAKVSYQLQYALGGTNFASPTSVVTSSFQRIYTKFQLNKLAIDVGVPKGTQGDVDFRIKATNADNMVQYSNTKTITVSTYFVYNSIGIIGTATAGGASVDTDLYRPDLTKPTKWTASLYLTGGNTLKFRADDANTVVWSDAAFPSGTGTQGGADIPIANSGYYQIDFDSKTGVYNFTTLAPATYTNVSLIGDFNGWGSDVDLTADGTGHIWTGTLSLASSSGLKLRTNHAWATAYGGITYPAGYSSSSGGNITVPAGNYFVYFNDVSGELFFGSTSNNGGAGTPYTQIGGIGDFNGWGSDAYLIKDPTNPYKWSAKLTFGSSGGVKFRANSAWATSWGGSTFPSGQGTTNNDPNISVSSGEYQITFNSATGQYTFYN